MASRRRSERIILGDILLFFYLIEDANKQGHVDGVTKLQKLVFLSELAMFQQNIVGFNYPFIKLHYGPFSSGVDQDHGKGLKTEILTESRGILVTNYGKNLLENFREVFETNEPIVGVIQDINREFAAKSREDILEYVYAMPHPIRKTYTIEQTKFREVLLTIPSERLKKKTKSVFELSEDWATTLEVYLDPEFYHSLKRAQAEAKSKTALSYEEVFEGV